MIYNKRVWLNDETSHFTGSVVCYFDDEKGDLIFEIADCGYKIQLCIFHHFRCSIILRQLKIIECALKDFLSKIKDQQEIYIRSWLSNHQYNTDLIHCCKFIKQSKDNKIIISGEVIFHVENITVILHSEKNKFDLFINKISLLYETICDLMSHVNTYYSKNSY